MAIVKELKNLGKKMTGVDLTGNTVSETLKAIEEKYSGGGSEPSYETVAEFDVGTMELSDGSYVWSESADSVPTETTLYFNSVEHPMTRYDYDGVTTYVCNYNIADGSRPDESAPGYALMYQPAQDAYICTVASSDDLSGETVRILKAASAPSSGGGEFIITGNITPTIDASGAITAIAWSNISVSSIDEINAAIEAGLHVVLRGSFSPQTGVDLTFDFPLTGRTAVSTGDMPDSFYFAGEIVLIDNEAVGFALDVFDVASVLGQDGNIYVMSAVKPQNKDHFEFGFTVAQGQAEGELIATPDTGVTYAAITAALRETPNVYAVLDLSFQNQVIRALFSVDSTASGGESTSAVAFIWGGTKWMGARLTVPASGAPDIIIRET